MEVYERINLLIKQKQLTKREFAKKLRDLEPKLNSTGEIPTEKTIYKYLDGSLSIKIELIPYIAEVLQVFEQDLFTNDEKTRKKFFQNILKNIDENELQIIKNRLQIKYETEGFKENLQKEDKKSSLEIELINLLPFAPKPLIKTLVNKLKEIKELSDIL